MCTFVTALLPKDVDYTAIDAVAKEHSLQCLPYRHTTIEAMFNGEYRYYYTTYGFCDCSTFIGRRPAPEDIPPDPSELLPKGYRPERWSKHKLERWREEKRKALAKQKEERLREGKYQEWKAFLTRILGEELTPEIGILHHFYNYRLDYPFELKGIEVAPLEIPFMETLYALPDAKIMFFRPEHVVAADYDAATRR